MCPFYSTMLRRARYATVCRRSVLLSVCLSVTFRYRHHIGWNTSKIMTRLISLRLCSGWPQHGRFATMGTPPKLEWNMGGVQKTCMSLKRCKIGARTNRTSHTRFRLTLKSMTFNHLERPKRTLTEKMLFYGARPPCREIWIKIDIIILSVQNVGRCF